VAHDFAIAFTHDLLTIVDVEKLVSVRTGLGHGR